MGRTGRTLKRIGVTAIALVILYFALWGASSLSLRRAYAALEADGRPMSAGEIMPPPVPDADNGALDYEAAVALLEAQSEGDSNLSAKLGYLPSQIDFSEPDSEGLQKFRALVKSLPVIQALVMLEEGASKPGCRYDIDYSKGAAMLFPHVSDLRNLSRIICGVARVQAIDGDHASAWRTVITGLRLADALKSEPMLISQLVRMAQFGLIADTIQSLCAYAPPTDEQYPELEELLVSFEDHTPLVRAMDAERLLFGESVFNASWSEQGEILEWVCHDGWRLPRLLVLFRPVLQRDHAAHLHVMHAYAQSAANLYTAEDVTFGEQLVDRIPRYCILTRMLTPAMSSCKTRFVAMIARARVARTGLAVLRYHQKHNAYPKDLTALGQLPPLDPFLGQPLGFRSSPTNVTVYSIGRNLVDDGGLATENSRTGDIVWQYPSKEELEPES